jgi:hypothetical protein
MLRSTALHMSSETLLVAESETVFDDNKFYNAVIEGLLH